jgi:hypothetical protein
VELTRQLNGGVSAALAARLTLDALSGSLSNFALVRQRWPQCPRMRATPPQARSRMQWTLHVLRVRVLSAGGDTVETIDLSPGNLDLPKGYWKWAKERDFS